MLLVVGDVVAGLLLGFLFGILVLCELVVIFGWLL